jgi:alpha-mannosidase
VEPTQTLYSWVMNNHWHTNYRAEQEGPVVFRFAIRPHQGTAPGAAGIFGLNYAQPLLGAPADSHPLRAPTFEVSPRNAFVGTLKPADDGQGVVLRVFGAAGRPEEIRVRPRGGSTKVWRSNTAEQRLSELKGSVSLSSWGLISVRVE